MSEANVQNHHPEEIPISEGKIDLLQVLEPSQLKQSFRVGIIIPLQFYLFQNYYH